MYTNKGLWLNTQPYKYEMFNCSARRYALLLVYVWCKNKGHGYIFTIIGKTALEDSARTVSWTSASRFTSSILQGHHPCVQYPIWRTRSLYSYPTVTGWTRDNARHICKRKCFLPGYLKTTTLKKQSHSENIISPFFSSFIVKANMQILTLDDQWGVLAYLKCINARTSLSWTILTFSKEVWRWYCINFW
jgi:hypothetical protein